MEELDQIKLGSKVRDKVTCFEGIATARIRYMNGCVQYCVEPMVDKEGKMPEHHYIDFGQLEVIVAEIGEEKNKEKGPGGMMPNVPE